MSKKNELKDYLAFSIALATERKIIADCKLGKIDCGVSPSFLLARERILKRFGSVLSFGGYLG